MAQEWAGKIYKSVKWQRCRNAYIQRRIMADGGLCEECRRKPGHIIHYKEILTADNILNPEISLKIQSCTSATTNL